MKISPPKKVSVALFYNQQGQILIQDRRDKSKWGEKYGLFGGKAEDGETPKETIDRELKEELELINYPVTLFKNYTWKNIETGVKVKRTVYLGEMPDISELVCHEGKMEVRNFKDSLELKMISGFNELMVDIYNTLKAEGKIID